MRYLSVCSGIEAATVAWQPLGWAPVGFSEIDKFPSAVLAHHYPEVPNFGDLTKFQEWPDVQCDVLVGGTPCQSFSVAGLRAGLADPRGNLALTFLGVADRFRPRWLVWENVPGVLSSGRGRDFGAFLGALGHLGYGFAYRSLDAQYFGLAQRRKRVFVVGYLGDWRRAAAVLFERESLRRDSPPCRETGEGVAGTPRSRTSAGGGLGTDFDCSGGVVPVLASTGERARALTTSNQRIDAETETFVISHSLRADGFDASEDGTGRGTPLVPILAKTLTTGGDGERGYNDPTNATLVAFNLRGREGGAMPEMSDVASLRSASGGSSRSYVAGMQVRRLTPRECERLQGFPDDYTLIPYRGKPAADGPRYKALGNSFAVPVVRWIGQRIQALDALE